MKELEKNTASPELQLFFERLLDLKDYVKERAKALEDPVIQDIYEKLDSLIKEEKRRPHDRPFEFF